MKQPRSQFSKRGMTFVELVVVLGIFGAIASTVLFNYRDFSDNVSLQNLAQDIALQVKRAQTYALSGKVPTLNTENNFNLTNLPADWTPSYGIAFDYQNHPTSFILYFNKDGDPKDFYDFQTGSYNPPCGIEPESECFEEIFITSGDFIGLTCFDFDDGQLSAAAAMDNPTCADVDGDDASSGAFVSFTRPRGNALITEDDDGSPGARRGNLLVEIRSPQGAHKFLSVWESGYISIR